MTLVIAMFATAIVAAAIIGLFGRSRTKSSRTTKAVPAIAVTGTTTPPPAVQPTPMVTTGSARKHLVTTAKVGMWVIAAIALIVLTSIIFGSAATLMGTTSSILDSLSQLFVPGFWVVLGIIFLLLALAGPKSSRAIFWVLLTGVFLYTSFPFINTSAEWFSRRVNYGDWSEPADYMPKVKNGTVKLARGDVKRFIAIDRVTLYKPSTNTCLGIAPSDRLYIEYSADGRYATVRPLYGQELVTARVKENGQEGCH